MYENFYCFNSVLKETNDCEVPYSVYICRADSDEPGKPHPVKKNKLSNTCA